MTPSGSCELLPSRASWLNGSCYLLVGGVGRKMAMSLMRCNLLVAKSYRINSPEIMLHAFTILKGKCQWFSNGRKSKLNFKSLTRQIRVERRSLRYIYLVFREEPLALWMSPEWLRAIYYKLLSGNPLCDECSSIRQSVLCGGSHQEAITTLNWVTQFWKDGSWTHISQWWGLGSSLRARIPVGRARRQKFVNVPNSQVFLALWWQEGKRVLFTNIWPMLIRSNYMFAAVWICKYLKLVNIMGAWQKQYK